MRRWWVIVLGFIIVAATMAYWSPRNSDGSLKDQVSNLQTEYDKLVADYDELMSQHQSLQEDEQSLSERSNSSVTQLTEAHEELAESKRELESMKYELSEAERDLESVSQELELYRKTGIQVFTNVQPPYSKANTYSQIRIKNNPDATDPTWEQVRNFLRSDNTDEKLYFDNLYVCGDFAEAVHNNAESAGLKCAVVALHFADDESHALNAFNTTDKGLVYVDCTGQEPQLCRYYCEPYGGECKQECPDYTSDSVAFVSKGRKYGRLDLADNTPLSYEGYERIVEDESRYEQQLQAYNAEVDKFNQEIEGKIYYIGTTEERRISQWSDELDEKNAELEKQESKLINVWEVGDTVTSIEIYW